MSTGKEPESNTRYSPDGERVRGAAGLVQVLTQKNLKAILTRMGLPAVEGAQLRTIDEAARSRIRRRLESDLITAVRFGAFSYLLESARALSKYGDLAIPCAVEVALSFLRLNPLPLDERILEESLDHFAKRIAENDYDWEGFAIAFLDPDAANCDRLRQNLKLTPAERWERHRNLMEQLRQVRRV